MSREEDVKKALEATRGISGNRLLEYSLKRSFGTPGGSDTQVQFNDGNRFGGDANFSYNKSTDTLSILNLSITGTSTTGNIIASTGSFTTGSSTINDAGGISSSDTSVTLASVTGLPQSGFIFVDSECIKYTGISGSTLTGLTRGTFGTSAAAHADGATVRNIPFIVALDETSSPWAAVQSGSGNPGGGRFSIGTMNTNSDITGVTIFRFQATSTNYFAFNNNNWLEFSDGTRKALMGPDVNQGFFLGTYSNDPITFRQNNGVAATIFTDKSLEIGTGTTALGTGRLAVRGGTNIATTDVAISAGWGASATVSAVTGKDQRGTITVTTNAADTPTANPTITLTFKNGTWTAAPFATVCMDHNSTGPSNVPATCVASATTLVISYRGTPTATSALTYIFNYVILG